MSFSKIYFIKFTISFVWFSNKNTHIQHLMLMAFISAGRLLTWHIKAKMAQLPLSSGICKLKENFEFFAQCLMLQIFNNCYYSRLTSTRPLKKCLAKKDWNSSAFGLSPIFSSLATPLNSIEGSNSPSLPWSSSSL